MFDAVLKRSGVATARLSRGAAISAAVHVGILAFVLWASTRPKDDHRDDPEVMFFSPKGKGLPGVPALAQGSPTAPVATAAAKPDKSRKRPDTVYNSKDKRAAPTKPLQSAAPANYDIYGSPDGDPDGDPLGSPTGTPGAGSPTGTILPPPPPPPPPPAPKPQNAVIPFGLGMERPHKVSGPDPVYTREAREAKVQGKVLAQCTITTDGRLVGCSIARGLPFMDQVVLQALSQQRWSPVVFQGQPVSVFYTIPFNFVLK